MTPTPAPPGMTRPDFVIDGSTVAVCEKICEYLRPELEGNERQIDRIVRVERHAMKFDTPEQIKRFLSHKGGGVRVCATQVSPVRRERGRGLIGSVELAAFVFTQDQFGYSRDLRSEVIAGRLATLITRIDAPKTLGAEGMALDVSMRGLSHPTLDELGCAVWAVTWTQAWRLDIPLDIGSLADFHLAKVDTPIADGAPLLKASITLERAQDAPPHESEKPESEAPA